MIMRVLIVCFFFHAYKFQTCNDPNCKTCVDPTVCTECIENSFLMNGKCPCFDRNCNKCSSSLMGSCQECNKGFILYQYKCRCNILNCAFCNDNGCDQCDLGYELVNGECQYKSALTCQDSNCLTCYSEQAGSCVTCKTGTSIFQGKCDQNPSCSSSLDGQCENCPDPFYLVNDVCSLKCLGQVCVDGNCDNPCLKCYANMVFETLNCRPNGYCSNENCDQCRMKRIGNCERCRIGYRLFQGDCSRCSDPNCLQCSYSNNGECNTCLSGYEKVDNTCVKKDTVSSDCNVSNCNTCLTASYCGVCNPGYSMSNGECFENNIPNCKMTIQSNVCAICNDPYTLYNNQCTERDCKIDHCDTCSVVRTCTKCEKNYALKNEKCLIAPVCNIDKCLECGSTKTCSKCDDFFYVDSNQTKCLPCKDHNCKLCDDVNCMKCKDNFSIANKTCYSSVSADPIDNCNLYDSNNLCVLCQIGCELNKGKCNCTDLSTIIIAVCISVICGISCIICITLGVKRMKDRTAYENARLQQNRSPEEYAAELRLIESLKIKEKELDQISDADSKIPKCKKCENDSAMYQLSCGCILCYNHGNSFVINETELNLNKKNQKCPVCDMISHNIIKLNYQCGICFEVTSKSFHFSCNCAMESCGTCYNKCLETKKCPGCRKDIINMQKEMTYHSGETDQLNNQPIINQIVPNTIVVNHPNNNNNSVNVNLNG